MSSSIRAVSAVLLALSLYGLILPEASDGMNRLLSSALSSPFPPKQIQKTKLTAGISRDFRDLRRSYDSPIRNPLSRTLFTADLIVLIISAAVLLRKNRR